MADRIVCPLCGRKLTLQKDGCLPAHPGCIAAIRECAASYRTPAWAAAKVLSMKVSDGTE